MIGNAIIGQSGGPTAVINASLYGIMSSALNSGFISRIYGMEYGIQGILDEKIVDLTPLSLSSDFKYLKYTPAAYLGTCRKKLSDDLSDPSYIRIFELLSKNNIKYFFYIGGNDSMDTVNKLQKYSEKIGYEIKIMGIPKTIDNDLSHTDHTPGYGSAAKYIACSMREILFDTEVYDVPSVTVTEIMGRHTGWLTASAVLARRFEGDNPLLFYLPENVFYMDKFLSDIEAAVRINKSLVIAVSEGIKTEDGKFVCDTNSSTDAFGHCKLGGCAQVLTGEINQKLGIKAKSIELSSLQRGAAHFTSLTDINEAAKAGEVAVHRAINGETGKMISLKRIKNYEIIYESVFVEKTSNIEKTMPENYYTGVDISPEFKDYCLPLILGEPRLQFENGLPKYLKRRS